MKLDIEGAEILFEFQAGTTMFDYAGKARAHVASRVLAISEAMNEADFRHLHFDLDRLRTCQSARDDALVRVRRLVQNRITNEIEARFDTSLSTWVSKVDAELIFDTARDRMDRMRFLGMDQVVPDKVLRKAVKYVFDCLNVTIGVHRGGHVVLGKPRISAVRASRYSTLERDRAWSLVVRTLDVLVRRAPLNGPAPELARLREFIEHRVGMSGSWGLIDIVLEHDRKRLGLQFPVAVLGDFDALLSEQQDRMNLASGLEA
ncbi:hypothetical protein [Brevundimonas sp.]|uniref:hypothetical protein n=1 Tax=Brevundimonas sp. TaxID=1871086 RepID=UPI00260F81C7|nr:hypothetical protein [Brevundimonas sp.]